MSQFQSLQESVFESSHNFSIGDTVSGEGALILPLPVVLMGQPTPRTNNSFSITGKVFSVDSEGVILKIQLLEEFDTLSQGEIIALSNLDNYNLTGSEQ